MTGVVLGGLLGLLFAVGVLVAVRSSPPMRPIRLVDRVAPYVADTPQPSRLLGTAAAPSWRTVGGPALAALTRTLDRIVGGRASVSRRLAGLGSGGTVEDFRIEQVVWGAVGLLAAGGLVATLGAARSGVSPLLVTAAALVGLVAGVLGRDWFLTQSLARREDRMMAEFPVVADLLALAVVAGEAPAAALARVCRLVQGELSRDLGSALARARSGEPLTRALTDLADATTLEPFGRFLSGLVVAIERGTPMADVLRAQSADVRESRKRALLESGGRKEVAMMVPVVFLILPVTVLFALYPGLLTLVSVTS
ncbi:type II secretion system F family protein [Jatrophihabitans sp. YIM 134969]